MSTSDVRSGGSSPVPDSPANLIRNAEGLSSNASDSLCRARDGMTLDRPSDHSLSYAIDQLGKVVNWAKRAQAYLVAAREVIRHESETAITPAEAACESPISDIIARDDMTDEGGGA